ncbi:enoyl-CoA hydratase/isomerase family protein [Nocardioides marmorisolisilvae]|uniref:Crotonase n=1 Tax=Nocardioides marmorisolisilvae TaxID=1542737 RepID=A0A3N0DRN4_9ACTN|nr:enoyl-CoA hydratase-related protein [Nocardioides marmorisolisilvae]RNL78298.1 crotonase [Nocardioides marmorisolisilvae]
MATSVRTSTEDGVAVLTLDGGDDLNLFSGATAVELGDALAEVAADDDVRVVVLTGAGRAFCAGADLAAGSGTFDAHDAFSASPVTPAPMEVPKLVVAAINGHAIGIGLTLALQCDLRFVAEGAKLAVPQVRRGMLGDAGSHYTLRHLAGTAVAAEVMLTGRSFTATEAVGWGIASRALPAEEVLPVAIEVARDVALNVSPASLALSKRILWSDLSQAETEARETAAHRLLMAHPDAAEGPAAWRERRAPRWTYRVSDLPD